MAAINKCPICGAYMTPYVTPYGTGWKCLCGYDTSNDLHIIYGNSTSPYNYPNIPFPMSQELFKSQFGSVME